MEKVGGEKPVILIVDDDPDILMLLELKLTSEGYTVKISPNGANMIDILTQSPPDLLLLDIRMNGVDGGTICQLIKSSPGTQGLPVIFFSANDNIEFIARNCGANGFIRKPYNNINFRQEISRVLGN